MRRGKCVYNEEIEIKKKIYYLHICKKSYYKLQMSNKLGRGGELVKGHERQDEWLQIHKSTVTQTGNMLI